MLPHLDKVYFQDLIWYQSSGKILNPFSEFHIIMGGLSLIYFQINFLLLHILKMFEYWLWWQLLQGYLWFSFFIRKSIFFIVSLRNCSSLQMLILCSSLVEDNEQILRYDKLSLFHQLICWFGQSDWLTVITYIFSDQ